MDAAIEKTQIFLGTSYSKDQVEKLKDHLEFDNMKSELSEFLFSKT